MHTDGPGSNNYDIMDTSASGHSFVYRIGSFANLTSVSYPWPGWLLRRRRCHSMHRVPGVLVHAVLQPRYGQEVKYCV
ncbi:hypothetical protein RCIA101 [Methanocella arvoryzae MRE50]|uniref:Uncharacterized protein n=1 Tax=Methanocella arvoryzae (strain DSM 22066 / NBRC 105507 / MRE50) TaxID=351160 RepID=Q0W4P2_METAR|nr:hypothetical protein RCIA101 [Methanocella arvoryzae MRE50]